MQDAAARRLSNQSGDEVLLLRVALQASPPQLAEYRRLLTDEERQRADRFITAELTRRWVVCRAVLRHQLGQLLQLPPAELRFQTGPHGKPSLVTDLQSAWKFNVSHTQDVALMAFARGRELGVDIESHDRTVSRDELAARFFSPVEREAYFSLPADRREQSFYRIWTCKEAYLKAIGAGLSFPLGQFAVASHPDAPPGLLHVAGEQQECGRWVLVAPDVGPGMSAALAVEGQGWSLCRQDWDHRAGMGVNWLRT